MKTSSTIEKESFVKEITRTEYEDNYLGDPDAVINAFDDLFETRKKEIDAYVARSIKEFDSPNIINPTLSYHFENVSYHKKYLEQKQVWKLECMFEIKFTTTWKEAPATK